MRLGRPLVVLAGVVGAAALLVAWGSGTAPTTASTSVPAPVRASVPPFAAGDEAANIALRSRGERVLIRWVARRTGRLAALSIRVKVSPSGYGGGTTGTLHAATYRVRPDGRPRTSALLGTATLSPGRRQWGGTVLLPLRIAVRAGQELATVIRNDAADPLHDYFSVNFLHAERGVLGANARNERSRDARDAYYGLDPRELVGFSRDEGRSWELPGGPYGAHGGRAFIPTYVQVYSDSRADGQFYYYSEQVSGTVTMVYPKVAAPWTIRALGAFAGGGASDVVLAVDGERRAAVRLSAHGFASRSIPPVTVPRGATVTVTARAGRGGLALAKQHADAVWAHLVGLGTRYRWYLDGDPDTAVAVYPLPGPPIR